MVGIQCEDKISSPKVNTIPQCLVCDLAVALLLWLLCFQGISSVGLKAVVQFAYTGSLSLDLENLEDILAAVSHLQVSTGQPVMCRSLNLQEALQCWL